MHDDEHVALYVDRYYEMDPAHEDVIYGTDLRNGMIVLLESMMLRGDPERITADQAGDYERRRVREVNQWCEVSQLRLTPRLDSPLVSFLGLYSDGVKRTRSYDASYAWIVKRDTVTR